MNLLTWHKKANKFGVKLWGSFYMWRMRSTFCVHLVAFFSQCLTPIWGPEEDRWVWSMQAAIFSACFSSCKGESWPCACKQQSCECCVPHLIKVWPVRWMLLGFFSFQALTHTHTHSSSASTHTFTPQSVENVLQRVLDTGVISPLSR